MNRGLKITFAALAIIGLGAGLAADYYLNSGLTVVPIAKESVDKKEITKGTIIYVYGRILTGTYEEVSAVQDPTGMMMLTGSFSSDPNDYDGKHTTQTIFVYVSMNKATEAEIKDNNLIPLGGLNVPYFYMEETFEGEDYSTVYITDNPTGPGKVVAPVTDEEAEIHIVRNKKTEEYDCVSYSRAEELIKDRDEWEYVGPCTRDNALKAHKGVRAFFHDGCESELGQIYFKQLATLAAGQDVPGMGR